MQPSSGFVGWYFGEPNGTRTGPLTTEEVVTLIESGHIQPKQWLWRAWKDRLGLHFYPTLAEIAFQMTNRVRPSPTGASAPGS